MQKRQKQRATFNDIVHFIERQVKILSDSVFGDIQDLPSAANRGTNQPAFKSRSRPKGSSFATTMTTVENSTATSKGRPDITTSAKKVCMFCEGGHTVEFCQKLDRTHAEKMTF